MDWTGIALIGELTALKAVSVDNLLDRKPQLRLYSSLLGLRGERAFTEPERSLLSPLPSELPQIKPLKIANARERREAALHR